MVINNDLVHSNTLGIARHSMDNWITYGSNFSNIFFKASYTNRHDDCRRINSNLLHKEQTELQRIFKFNPDIFNNRFVNFATHPKQCHVIGGGTVHTAHAISVCSPHRRDQFIGHTNRKTSNNRYFNDHSSLRDSVHVS